jgi:hypothetical protein
MMPTRKVGTGLIVGQVAAVAAWALNEFWRIEIPPEIALSIGGILIASVQFMVTDK